VKKKSRQKQKITVGKEILQIVVVEIEKRKKNRQIKEEEKKNRKNPRRYLAKEVKNDCEQRCSRSKIALALSRFSLYKSLLEFACRFGNSFRYSKKKKEKSVKKNHAKAKKYR